MITGTSPSSGIPVISGRTSKIITTIQDRNTPDAVAVSPRTGDVYVTNEGNGDGGSIHPGGVWVISGRTSKITATIPDANGPYSVAVSPRNGDVYVGNSGPADFGVWVISG
jgi:DNA-binding beta-propeller fold protein YncE